jgi:hypothetical protein
VARRKRAMTYWSAAFGDLPSAQHASPEILSIFFANLAQ